MQTKLAIPGFIDLQVNGFIGVDFSCETLNEDDFLRAGHALIERGTAAFMPTLISNTLEYMQRNLKIMISALKKDALLNRHVLGFHLEGPFISSKPGAVGAHKPDIVLNPDIAFFDQLYALCEGRLRLLTIAAEQPGAEEFTAHAVSRGVAISCGHQLAGPDDLARLVAAGATALTHLGNGLPNLVHRHNNPMLAGLAEERLQVMFIPDGFHLPQHLLKIFARAAGAKRLIATSDASPIAGLPPGTYNTLGNKAVLKENGMIYNPDKQCLVGSSFTMLQCMNVLHQLNVFSLEELISIGFDNPLALINADASEIATCKYKLTFSQEKGFALA